MTRTHLLNLFTDEFFADPHAAYASLRESAPVHHVITPNGQAGWLVIGHAEARAALSDPRFSKDIRVAKAVYDRHADPTAPDRDFAQSLNAHMLNTDPPEHTRLRKLVGRAFTPRRVEALQPRIQEVTDELMVRLAAGGQVDLMETVAVPLPITVICELLGIPEPARDTLRHAVADLLSVGDPTVVDRASHTLAALMMQTLASKRADPGDDLLTALIAAHDEDDRLTGPELVSMAMLLLVAGHETTVNLVANAVTALLAAPDVVEALRADRAAVPAAVEELLRFDGPVNIATFRFTTDAVDLGGVEIPAEHPVIVSPLAANRDPARFPDPHTLRLDREPGGHIAFGHGVHHCIGAALGRMEAAIMIDALLDHLPNLALAVPADQLRWRRSLLVRGMEELPLTSRRQNGGGSSGSTAGVGGGSGFGGGR